MTMMPVVAMVAMVPMVAVVAVVNVPAVVAVVPMVPMVSVVNVPAVPQLLETAAGRCGSKCIIEVIVLATADLAELRSHRSGGLVIFAE